MAPRSLSHSPGSGHQRLWNNGLSGTNGSQTCGFTNALRAIEFKEKSFRAHRQRRRSEGLDPDESHPWPDRVNGSLVKSVLGGGARGVLTYQLSRPVCLSTADPGSERGGLSQATRGPAVWSELSGLSAGARGILNSSVMLTGDEGWGKELPECRENPAESKAVKNNWFGLEQGDPLSQTNDPQIPFVFQIH